MLPAGLGQSSATYGTLVNYLRTQRRGGFKSVGPLLRQPIVFLQNLPELVMG